MMVDSLDMRYEDRWSIAQKCLSCEEDHIIIHGTDTMSETARVIGEINYKKTIVLTGAIIPIKFGNSDDLFNLGCAIAFVQVLPPGVYVAMNDSTLIMIM